MVAQAFLTEKLLDRQKLPQIPVQWTVGVSPLGERLSAGQEFEKLEGFRCVSESEHEKTEGLR